MSTAMIRQAFKVGVVGLTVFYSITLLADSQNNTAEQLPTETLITTKWNTTTMKNTAQRLPEISNAQEAQESLVWDKKPIGLTVPVGKERMITFPEAVEFINDNPLLTKEKATVLNNAGTLYIKALQAFDPIRVQVRLKQSDKTVLMDISGIAQGKTTPIQIILADTVRSSDAESQDKSKSYISLLRFAIQQLYAPTRLITRNEAIARTPMHTSKSVILFYGGTTLAYPLTSWTVDGLFVTAVQIKNTRSYAITLDPRQALGRWRAAVFYPTNQLAERGNPKNTTTVFLISDEPFGQALTGLKKGIWS